MMIQTTLQIGTEDNQKSFRVWEWSCRYSRKYNGRMPISIPRCESIQLTLSADNNGMNTDSFFYEWYAQKMTHSGKLICELVDAKATEDQTRELEFHDAMCLGISEHFTSAGKLHRIITLELAPAEVTVEDVQIINYSI